MKEKTVKSYSTTKGNKIEIYQFRILLNGKYSRFLAFTVNGEDKKGCFLINELQMMEYFINNNY